MLLLKYKMFISHEGFLTNAMYHHRETIKSNKHIMMIQRKRAHDSQIVRAKENLKLKIGLSKQCRSHLEPHTLLYHFVFFFLNLIFAFFQPVTPAI